MSPIRAYIDDAAAFDAEATAAMSRAFEEICAHWKIPSDAAHEREVIAVRVIDLARAGIVDAQALRERVLLEGRLES